MTAAGQAGQRRWQKPMLGAAISGAIWHIAVANAAPDTQGGCSRAVVARAPSPDRARTALVVESVCGAGGYAQDVTAEVRIGTATILGVDTGGHESDRPLLLWASPTVLDVTVPNLSFLHVLALRADGVEVRLQFAPDRPAVRAAWLHDHGLPPDPPGLAAH